MEPEITYLVLGGLFALMMVSTWFTVTAQSRHARGLAAMALVASATGFFVYALYFAVILAIAIAIVVPICLVLYFFNGAF